MKTKHPILDLFYEEMKEKGLPRSCVHLDIDEIKKRLSPKINRDEIINITKKYAADGWLKYSALGQKCFEMTEQGFGVVKSLHAQQELMLNKDFSKKISDFFQERSGLFLPINMAISVFALVVAICSLLKGN